ncbi:hypothetical protein C2E23DRAFT_802889 [Lenzites betulinus]|nr:hypothetical protein C2E23DRAFT_802889 [Lenzites betulinus]
MEQSHSARLVSSSSSSLLSPPSDPSPPLRPLTPFPRGLRHTTESWYATGQLSVIPIPSAPSLAMSSDRDLLYPFNVASDTMMPLHDQPLLSVDASRSGLPAASLHDPQASSEFQMAVSANVLVDPPAPPYDEFSREFGSGPRRSTDRSMLYPRNAATPDRSASAAPSGSSTATNTPMASRNASPLPFDYSGASSCDSDSDSEPESGLLSRTSRRPHFREGRARRWWSLSLGSNNSADSRRPRRPWRDAIWGVRSCRRIARRCIRHPLFPKTPVTILLSLLFLTLFGVSLTFLLIYILNPDKEPLPWRGYCTLPQYSGGPPPLSLSTTTWLQTPLSTNFTLPQFPPTEFDSLAPAGVFLGVFTIDTGVERRMYIRSTWATHLRSREGGGDGDGGVGTSRTIVRFIMGQPRKEWERQVQLEVDTYNDIVILPMAENMNQGKTHAYFTWAANNSWVPPVYHDGYAKKPEGFSYTDATSPPPQLASHDPALAHLDQYTNGTQQPWVRPDFVVKADDDAFVMLAELEGRLRVELYKDRLPPPPVPSVRKQQTSPRAPPPPAGEDVAREEMESAAMEAGLDRPTLSAVADPADSFPSDPLVFWGYLIKNRFMGGEMYALSFPLVNWIAQDPVVKTMTHGAEDKQTSKWIRRHPLAEQVRWASERCWIYDHPRAGTVYSHGFLFPSEVNRVRPLVSRDLVILAKQTAREADTPDALAVPPGQNVPAPEHWARSTVSTFGTRYVPPVPGLTLDQSVEALVEGSDMSKVTDAQGALTPEVAWQYREGRRTRYAGQRLGGTVVVHFIKKNMWFLETAEALLHGEEVTPVERGVEMPRVYAHRNADAAELDGPPTLDKRSIRHGEQSVATVLRDSAASTPVPGVRTVSVRGHGDRGLH